MPALEHTSIPSWARGEAASDLDPTGASYLLVAVGAEGSSAHQRVAAWCDEVAPRPATAIAGPAADALAAPLEAALKQARVGVRLALSGSVGDCLALRALAVRAGLEDDEIHVETTPGGVIDLHCVHCTAATSTTAAIDDVVACSGCGRSLLVYYHVSRRTGRFLGFQVDAEEAVS